VFSAPRPRFLFAAAHPTPGSGRGQRRLAVQACVKVLAAKKKAPSIAVGPQATRRHKVLDPSLIGREVGAGLLAVHVGLAGVGEISGQAFELADQSGKSLQERRQFGERESAVATHAAALRRTLIDSSSSRFPQAMHRSSSPSR
jgi:hypothetical protein